jgi:hypothetical protein
MSNQSSEIGNYKQAAVLASILVVLAGFFLWEALNFQSQATKLEEASSTTTATIVGKAKGGKRPSEIWLAFVDSQGAEVRATAKFIAKEHWENYEPGDRIPVKYARADSQIVEIEGQYQSSMVTNRLGFSAALGLAALITIAYGIKDFFRQGGGGGDVPPAGPRTPPSQPRPGPQLRTGIPGSTRPGFGRRT